MFHASTADEVLYGGARGGGKSVALIMEAWQRSVETPGHKSLILRRSYKQLEKSLIRHMREHFPENFGHFVKNDMTYHFPNGSLIDFGYLNTDDDKYEYQGREYDFVGFEELTQFTYSQYSYILSSIRTSKEAIMPVIRCTSNPGNIGHNWVKSRFLDFAEPMEKKEVDLTKEMAELKEANPEVDLDKLTFTRQFIPSTVFDNQHIVDNDPMYILRLQQLPIDEREAYLYGNWDVFGGQVFKEFNKKKHTLTPFNIPSHWQKYMSIDWGYKEPFAIVWGTVVNEDYKINGRTLKEGSVIIYREHYGTRNPGSNEGIELEASEVASNVIDMEDEQVHIRIADHDMFAKRGHSAPTIAETFGEYFLYLTRADKGSGSRIQGKMEMHKRFRIEDEEPSLYFLDDCKHCIRTIPSLPYSTSSRNPEDVETKNVEDHLYDAVRYLLMARPIGRDEKPKRIHKKKKGNDKYTGY